MKYQIKWRLLMVVCVALLLLGMASAVGTESELGYTPLSELIPKGAKTVTFRDISISAYMNNNHEDIQNADGSFAIADLAEIDFISIWCYKPIDLSEMQLFPRLGGLCIYDSPEVTGVMALAQCKKLDYLSFSNITQMNVEELTQAVPKTLSVSFTQCGDLDYAAIAGWKKLSSVDLQGNAIRDLSYLAKIPALEDLMISDAPNADLASCQDLSTLTSLRAYDNVLPQNPLLWQLIANNPKLGGITLGMEYNSETYDFDGAAFQNLKKLTDLDVSGAIIQDLGFLKNCPNLTTLAFEKCTFVSPDMDSLKGLKKLSELALCNVGLTDVSFVKGMKLSLLWLPDNDITDISPLMGAKQIGKLSLYGNDVEDWAPLTKIKGLKKLFYSGSKELPKLKNVEVERDSGSWMFETIDWDNLF